VPRTPRRRTPRRLPPRPTYTGAPAVEAEPRRVSARDARPQRYIERESPYLAYELRRVLGVTSVCFGLLAVLTVVDRLQ
jgi:hypothetical protein